MKTVRRTRAKPAHKICAKMGQNPRINLDKFRRVNARNCHEPVTIGAPPQTFLLHELMEARDERRLRALQKHLNTVKLLIVDELGYVPFTAVGSELLFEVFSQRYERGATLVTSNLPFDEWTSIFGSERLTGALLDRLTHHVHILEMNGTTPPKYKSVPKHGRNRRASQPFSS
jgi:hypothetical protein